MNFLSTLDQWGQQNQPTVFYMQGMITGILVSMLLHMCFYTTFNRLRNQNRRPTRVEDLKFEKDDFKMVLLVRTDLKMEKGKVAAQCCHAALAAFQTAIDDQNQRHWLNKWEDSGTAKITLKCPDEESMYFNF
jgi:hypothetical protein